jgi:hypothetical protein
MRSACFQESDKEAVEDDLPAVIGKVNYPSGEIQDPCRVIVIESLCKFGTEEGGKISSYIMVLHCIIERIADNACQDEIMKRVQFPPNLPADCQRLLVPLSLEIQEWVSVSDLPAGLSVNGACDLRVEERGSFHGFQEFPTGIQGPIRTFLIGGCNLAFKNYPG